MICPKCHSENPAGFSFCGGVANRWVRRATRGSFRTGKRTSACDRTVHRPDGVYGHVRAARSGRHQGGHEPDLREIAQVVTKYEGVIEKFIGDAAMVLFGVPRAHEDDPVRAIKAAMEIHGLVEALSPQVRAFGCKPLSMHTGIDTGLVVTGGLMRGKGQLALRETPSTWRPA